MAANPKNLEKKLEELSLLRNFRNTIATYRHKKIWGKLEEALKTRGCGINEIADARVYLNRAYRGRVTIEEGCTTILILDDCARAGILRLPYEITRMNALALVEFTPVDNFRIELADEVRKQRLPWTVIGDFTIQIGSESIRFHEKDSKPA